MSFGEKTPVRGFKSDADRTRERIAAIERDRAEADRKTASAAFDFLEGLAGQLSAQGDPRGFEMRAGFARGTGGIDADFLIEVLSATTPKPLGDVREDHAASLASPVVDVREAWAKARTAAFMLLQNSEGCATNHYGHDHVIYGMPGWLADCRRDLEAADTILALAPNLSVEPKDMP